jgi:hypothetical protein
LEALEGTKLHERLKFEKTSRKNGDTLRRIRRLRRDAIVEKQLRRNKGNSQMGVETSYWLN